MGAICSYIIKCYYMIWYMYINACLSLSSIIMTIQCGRFNDNGLVDEGFPLISCHLTAQIVGWNWNAVDPEYPQVCSFFCGTDEFLFHGFIAKKCLERSISRWSIHELLIKNRSFHPKMTFSPISRPIWLVPWLQEVATRTRPLIWIGDLNVAADRVDARRFGDLW